MSNKRIRILHVYDRFLNIYADRGNIQVLQKRCAWRGIDTQVRTLDIGDTFSPSEVDLIYIGGGQDRDQAMIAEHLCKDLGSSLIEAVEEGVAVLAVCGGYQLLGDGYVNLDQTKLPGVGLFDVKTQADTTRLVGNIAIDVKLPALGDRPEVNCVVSGYENHAGRTTLGETAHAFGQVISGKGNDGTSNDEGCRLQNALGTYLHGPLLPRNPEIADWLLAAALTHAYSLEETLLIDDSKIPNELKVMEKRAKDISISRAASE